MTWLQETVEAIWTHESRTLASGSAAPASTAAEEYARAVWDNSARTLTAEPPPPPPPLNALCVYSLGFGGWRRAALTMTPPAGLTMYFVVDARGGHEEFGYGVTNDADIAEMGQLPFADIDTIGDVMDWLVSDSLSKGVPITVQRHATFSREDNFMHLSNGDYIQYPEQGGTADMVRALSDAPCHRRGTSSPIRIAALVAMEDL